MSFKFYLYADINSAGSTFVWSCCRRNQRRTFSQLVYLGDNIAQKYAEFLQSGANMDSPFRYVKNEPYVFPETVDDNLAEFDIDFFTGSLEITYFNDDEIICKKEITSSIVHQERLTENDLLETRVLSK